MDFTDISPAYGDLLFFMLGALLLFLVLFVVYLWLVGWGRKGQGANITLRPIPGYDATREGLATAAETGRAVHTSPGTGGVGARGVTTASTLAGMAIVESMARVSAITGAPVQATTNDAVAYALTDNALRRGYLRAGWSMESENTGVRFLTHSDPLAYAAAAAEVVRQNRVSHAVMAGQFGPEVLLITEAQRRSGAQQIAGASDPQALALMTITVDHTLIGEEIFASGAYLEQRRSHIASLLAQDGLRWVVIAIIIAGFIIVNILGQEWATLFSLYP
ncbi:MAG TPA: DUF6754 domain-containing protein [Chloroflexia bacterium]|nr:DUF6754 domain-containing protein [Chloroflexia bacterium]